MSLRFSEGRCAPAQLSDVTLDPLPTSALRREGAIHWPERPALARLAADREKLHGFGVRACGVAAASRPEVAAGGRLKAPLSRREQQVLTLLARGCSNREMAHRLIVSKDTVKYHLKNLYGKLSAGRRTEALLAALQLGLLDADEQISPPLRERLLQGPGEEATLPA